MLCRGRLGPRPNYRLWRIETRLTLRVVPIRGASNYRLWRIETSAPLSLTNTTPV